MNLKIFLLLILLKFSFSQLLDSEINVKLKSDNDACINKEIQIVSALSDYLKLIKDCIKTLEQAKAPKDLIASLKHFETSIHPLMTLKSFDAYVPILNCTDIDTKIVSKNLEQEKFNRIKTEITSNTTKLYKLHTDLTKSYQSSLNALGAFTPNERMVWNILAQITSVMSEYAEYSRILNVNGLTLGTISTILRVEKKIHCECLNSANWTEYDGTAERSAQNLENRLIFEESQTANLSTLAIPRVKSAIALGPQNVASSLQQLLPILTHISTNSDYPKVDLKNITNCIDFYNRVIFMNFKQLSYVKVQSTLTTTFNNLNIYQLRVNLTASTAIMSSAQTQAVQTALNATALVYQRQSTYVAFVNFGIGRMMRIAAEFERMGEGACKCDGAGSN